MKGNFPVVLAVLESVGMLQKFTGGVIAVFLSSILTVGVVAPASAAPEFGEDYELGYQWWLGGCVITYSIEPGYGTDEYVPVIPAGLKTISDNSNFEFKQVPYRDGNSSSPANITFRPLGKNSVPKEVNNGDAMGYQDGPDIYLMPMNEWGSIPSGTADGSWFSEFWKSAPPESKALFRQAITTHEVLHFLGVHHSPDGADSIMNVSDYYFMGTSQFDPTGIHLTENDIAALAHVERDSSCSAGQTWETPVVPLSKFPKPPVFKAKKVTMYVPGRVLYQASRGKTTVITSSKKTVTAKSDGKYVYVKYGKQWEPVAYVYNKRTNSLNYNEGLRLLGLWPHDPNMDVIYRR